MCICLPFTGGGAGAAGVRRSGGEQYTVWAVKSADLSGLFWTQIISVSESCKCPQVVVRVRPMFDVEAARGEQYAVQTQPDDPRHLQVMMHV